MYETTSLADFRNWLLKLDDKYWQECNAVDEVPGGVDLRCSLRDAIDAKRERLATALNLIDEYIGK
jgi:hypothetical protein